MSSRPGGSGFEARTRDPERRDFFDLRRRLGVIESLLGLGNGGAPSGALDEVFIGNTAPPTPENYEIWYDPDAISGDPTPWTNVVGTNGWVNFGAPYATAQYRRLGDMIQLRGTIKSGTMSTAAFTLPTGFRPPAVLQVACESGLVYGMMQISSNGQCSPTVGSNAAFSFNTQFSVTA